MMADVPPVEGFERAQQEPPFFPLRWRAQKRERIYSRCGRSDGGHTRARSHGNRTGSGLAVFNKVQD